MIAGLIPAAVHVDDPEMRRALDERATLIEQRAAALAQQAITDRAPWLRELGPAPLTSQRRKQWLRNVITVAAYRERHGITGRGATGEVSPDCGNWTLRADRRRVEHIVRAARLGAQLDLPASKSNHRPQSQRSAPSL